MPRTGSLAGSCIAVAAFLVFTGDTRAERPSPFLQTVFPAGGRAGTAVTVSLSGSAFDGLRDVDLGIPGCTARKLDANRFAINLPAETPPGVYDLQAVGAYGLSSPRAFFVGNRAEQLETEPNDLAETAQHVKLDSVVNGRIDRPGDVDFYRFEARAGQRVVLECWAERIDSLLRAVLEVYDTRGKRLAVSRGHVGIDPLLDFRVPADGTYLVKVFDLSYLGGASHFYRLDIDTGPRVEFAVPSVVTRGQATRVRLLGRNLRGPAVPAANGPGLDCVEVEVKPPAAETHDGPPLPLRPAQLGVDAFPFYFPGGHAPVLLGLTDVPVVPVRVGNHSRESAQEIPVPCEVSGQLTEGEERHWFAVRARRGEVLWLEGFGERVGSPVDLDVTVLDATGRRELIKLTDEVRNLGGYRFATSHVDPAGRWVAPADGRYLVLVRSVTGGLSPDPRRVYRLSVRREEPDFHLAVVSRRTDQPAGLNVWRGGREGLEVVALRHRGLEGPIRVAAEGLPAGFHCPDVWIGPGQDCAPVVVSADREAPTFAGALKLVGHVDVGGGEVVRTARGGTMVWPGRPSPSGRLTRRTALATGPQSGLRLTASPGEAVIDQDSVLDVAVDLETGPERPVGPVALSGFGLPRGVSRSLATIPAGKMKGWISFHFPSSLPPGPYSIAVQAEVDVAPGKSRVILVSNPVTVRLRPAHIVVEIDPRTPRKIARGKIIQLAFTAERRNGFIGKVHTELAAPGGVTGLRARGLTFVSQAETGALQVIATEDAPLGRQPFLRLEAVGTVEDQPVYHASRFVDLEITE